MSDPNAFLYSAHTSSECDPDIDAHFYEWDNDEYSICFSLFKDQVEIFIMISRFGTTRWAWSIDNDSVWKKFKSSGVLEFKEVERLFNVYRELGYTPFGKSMYLKK